MSPMSRPLESRSRVNCHSTMRGDLLRVLDAGQRPERGLPAVLVGDRGGQLDLVPPPVKAAVPGAELPGAFPPPTLPVRVDLGAVSVGVFVGRMEGRNLRHAG